MKRLCYLLCYIPAILSGPTEKDQSFSAHGIMMGTMKGDLSGIPQNPMEIDGLFEGDIILPQSTGNRNAVRWKDRKWPNGVIPYEIATHQYDQKELDLIKEAMQIYHLQTCIRFREKTLEDKHYITIRREKGCYSSVGMQNRPQELSLGDGCLSSVGMPLHELMHAAGFYHEQSRNDRDDYITVVNNTIDDGKHFNFEKYDLSLIDHLGAPYDVCSIMHYNAIAFSKDKKSPTILVKKKGDCEIGGKNYFSELDIRKLNTLYKCEGYPQVGDDRLVPSPPCKDIEEKCPALEQQHKICQNKKYELAAKVYCEKTCGHCIIFNCKGDRRKCAGLESNNVNPDDLANFYNYN